VSLECGICWLLLLWLCNLDLSFSRIPTLFKRKSDLSLLTVCGLFSIYLHKTMRGRGSWLSFLYGENISFHRELQRIPLPRGEQWIHKCILHTFLHILYLAYIPSYTFHTWPTYLPNSIHSFSTMQLKYFLQTFQCGSLHCLYTFLHFLYSWLHTFLHTSYIFLTYLDKFISITYFLKELHRIFTIEITYIPYWKLSRKAD
jgi:hypothetical protein